MASESLFMILLLREIANQARPMVIRSTAARMSDFRYRRALPILTKGMRPFMRQSKSCRGLIRRKAAVSWSVMSLSSHCKPEGCSFMPKSACQPGQTPFFTKIWLMTIFDNLLTTTCWISQYGEIQCLQLTEEIGIYKS